MTAARTLATARRVLLQLRHDPRTLAMLLVVPVAGETGGAARRLAAAFVAERARRVVTASLRDKVDPGVMQGGATATRQSVLAADPVQEAISALLALGYKPPEASRAVQNIPSDGLSSEEIIRQALKGMVGAR